MIDTLTPSPFPHPSTGSSKVSVAKLPLPPALWPSGGVQQSPGGASGWGNHRGKRSFSSEEKSLVQERRRNGHLCVDLRDGDVLWNQNSVYHMDEELQGQIRYYPVSGGD